MLIRGPRARHSPPAVLAALVVLGLCLSPPARSQDEPAASSPADAAMEAESTATADEASPAAEEPSKPVSPVFQELSGKIERVGPDTFLLLGPDGQPQPVLNMSFDEFMRVWKQQQALSSETKQAANQPTLDELRLVGSLEDDHASLHTELSITLHESGTTEVPLSLAGALLRELPESPAGQAKRFLRYDASRGGYFAQLSGDAGQTVVVHMDLIVPVQRDGGRASLKLLAPRATKGSLVLVSTRSLQSVIASQGVRLRSTSLAAGGTRVEAEGIAGESSVSWVDSSDENIEAESMLTATTKVFVSIGGRNVRSRAQITVESFGPSFREFIVRLPPGAHHNPSGTPPSNVSITTLRDASSTGEEAGSNPQGSELRVTLPADQNKPATVIIDTIELLPAGDKNMTLELSGFEVLGALPQDGEVAVEVDDTWQVRCDPTDTVRLIHPAELDLSWMKDAPSVDELTMALRFARQPWSLPVTLMSREQRVVATPSYELTINPNEALLQMEVDYRIEGGRSQRVPFAPRFKLAGWEHLSTSTINLEGTQESGGPPDLETFGPRDSGENQKADYFGFSSAFATSRQPKVTLELRRTWKPEEADHFVLDLPSLAPGLDQPVNQLVINPSELTVLADTSLQLTPDAGQSRGLAAVPIEDGDDLRAGLPPGQQFRYRGVVPSLAMAGDSVLAFAAEKSQRPRRIVVQSHSDVGMNAGEIEVEQTFEFDVRHQPISGLYLACPSGVSIVELELLPAGGRSTSEVGVELEVPPSDADLPSRLPTVPEVRIALGHPRLGKFRVLARYFLDSPQSTGESPTLSFLTVPNAEYAGRTVPVAEFDGHTVRLASSEGQTFAATGGSGWQAKPTVEESTSILFAPQRTNFLPLKLVGQSAVADRLEIDRVWVETWLTPNMQQLRTCFQFHGTAERAKIELPGDTPAGVDFQVVLDGMPTNDWRLQGRSIDVPLVARPSSTYHTLELKYRLPCKLGWFTQVTTQRPRLAGSDSTPLFWQVIAPVQYHAVSAPSWLVPAFQTHWSDGDWRSESEKNTAELEQWVGAQPASFRPTSGEHAMLYRTSPDAKLEVTLVRRELLILSASAAALAVVLGLVYVPALRKPPALLAGMCLVMAIGLAVPTTMVFVAQLGLYGVVCGLLAWLLYLLYGGRNREISTRRSSSVLLQEASGSHRPSTLVPVHTGSASTNAPTISVELTDSNA
ncbi:hypothetical protein [Aeoliella straminimaris]|uniref:hypothetical protein n=1 Tax=Aeoliella straminimaris TaxID=2954799 RepID=UPI0020921F2C|nr:hypothetical protein [Aeoliella straminimaris]